MTAKYHEQNYESLFQAQALSVENECGQNVEIGNAQ